MRGGGKNRKGGAFESPASLCDVGLTPVRDDWSAPRDLSVSGSRAGLEGRPSSGCVSWPMALYLASRCYDGVPALAGLVPQSADEIGAREPHRLRQTALRRYRQAVAPCTANPSAFSRPWLWTTSGCLALRAFRTASCAFRFLFQHRPQPGQLTGQIIHERRGDGAARRGLSPQSTDGGSAVGGPVHREGLPLAEKLAMLAPAR